MMVESDEKQTRVRPIDFNAEGERCDEKGRR